MKKIFPTLIFCLLFLLGFGQKLIIQNAQEVDPNRYEEIKGSPYLFKGWGNATLIGLKGNETKDIRINYNGQEKQWEVLAEDKHIVLDTRDYKRMHITPPDGGEMMTFKRGVHRKYANEFIQVIYEGNQVKLIKEFIVDKSKQKIENVGKTIVVERFAGKDYYWLIKDDELTHIKMKKKDVVKQLGNGAIASYIKKEKIDFDKISDLQKLMTYYESL